MIEVLEMMWKETGHVAHVSIFERGIKHLNDYLLGHWMMDALWHSWSDFGCHIATQIMNCPLKGVLPTTNHLELFNGLLKWKHLWHWQNGGRHLHVDVLLKILITKVLPSIFEQRKMEKEQDLCWQSQM
jgi:hypothetical protein